jgi:hypothetical protein
MKEKLRVQLVKIGKLHLVKSNNLYKSIKNKLIAKANLMIDLLIFL